VKLQSILHLRVEWEFAKFEVLEEATSDSSPFANRCFSSFIVTDGLPYGLLRFAEAVFNVQLRIPILGPVDVLRQLFVSLSKVILP
jgi:hypothetical protein